MKVPRAEDIIYNEMYGSCCDSECECGDRDNCTCDDDSDSDSDSGSYGERIAQLVDNVNSLETHITAIAKCGERYYAVSYNLRRGNIDWSNVSKVVEVVPFNGDYAFKAPARAA